MRVATLCLSAFVLAACSGASAVPAHDPPARVAAATVTLPPSAGGASPEEVAPTKPLPGAEDVDLDKR